LQPGYNKRLRTATIGWLITTPVAPA